ncbi:2-oxoglutarate dehydrogenase complex dihydrolipoyllysine-residue succinyltransferase [uncultured Brevundimonas sp.]|uniref:2-oxoglutarate dehydrogenase complex dihydrolipoyllysine-residue succinyltransferase n=1 Tax=uncultured Brevundimonas sp. TaxID=213418 RepID=UPI0034561979
MADILTPALGESVTEATIAKWTKKVGDPVKKDELLVELETDKVSLEVVSPADGVLGDIKAAEGDNVVPGTVLGSVTEGASAAAAPAAAPAKAAKADAKAAAAAAAPAAAAAIDITVPVMGESVAEGSMGKWVKKNGDTVKKDELLVEIETDKVAVEVSAPADGVLTIAADEGATVTPGQKIGSISGSGSGSSAASAPAAATPAPAAVPANTGSAQVSAARNETLSPAVQRVVGENNLDPKAINATGPKGNITKADAIAAIGQASAPAPAAAAAPAAPRADQPREERVKMTRLRQTIARRLKESQNTAAQLTTFNEVDMTNVMALRAQYKDVFEKRHGVKLGFMSFFTKAVVAALHEIPAVNAEIDGTDIIYKNHYDIGVAVGTDKGLVVPVLRDADTLSLAGIEKGIGALGKAARDGSLTMDQMQGGTFTITNGGTYGSLMSTPILNAPQSGILGMHNIVQRPMAINGEVKIRPMMYLALSYDHRIVDGKEAVTFLVRVKELLEDPARALLDL